MRGATRRHWAAWLTLPAAMFPVAGTFIANTVLTEPLQGHPAQYAATGVAQRGPGLILLYVTSPMNVVGAALMRHAFAHGRLRQAHGLLVWAAVIALLPRLLIPLLAR